MASHMAQMQASHPEEKAFLGFLQISDYVSLPRIGPVSLPVSNDITLNGFRLSLKAWLCQQGMATQIKLASVRKKEGG